MCIYIKIANFNTKPRCQSAAGLVHFKKNELRRHRDTKNNLVKATKRCQGFDKKNES